MDSSLLRLSSSPEILECSLPSACDQAQPLPPRYNISLRAVSERRSYQIHCSQDSLFVVYWSRPHNLVSLLSHHPLQLRAKLLSALQKDRLGLCSATPGQVLWCARRPLVLHIGPASPHKNATVAFNRVTLAVIVDGLIRYAVLIREVGSWCQEVVYSCGGYMAPSGTRWAALRGHEGLWAPRIQDFIWLCGDVFVFMSQLLNILCKAKTQGRFSPSSLSVVA